MKLDRAIEIKSRTGEEFLHTDPDEIDEADSLSIEALKRIKACRESQGGSPLPPLASETEE